MKCSHHPSFAATAGPQTVTRVSMDAHDIVHTPHNRLGGQNQLRTKDMYMQVKAVSADRLADKRVRARLQLGVMYKRVRGDLLVKEEGRRATHSESCLHEGQSRRAHCGRPLSIVSSGSRRRRTTPACEPRQGGAHSCIIAKKKNWSALKRALAYYYRSKTTRGRAHAACLEHLRHRWWNSALRTRQVAPSAAHGLWLGNQQHCPGRSQQELLGGGGT